MFVPGIIYIESDNLNQFVSFKEIQQRITNLYVVVSD